MVNLRHVLYSSFNGCALRPKRFTAGRVLMWLAFLKLGWGGVGGGGGVGSNEIRRPIWGPIVHSIFSEAQNPFQRISQFGKRFACEISSYKLQNTTERSERSQRPLDKWWPGPLPQSDDLNQGQLLFVATSSYWLLSADIGMWINQCQWVVLFVQSASSLGKPSTSVFGQHWQWTPSQRDSTVPGAFNDIAVA
jgi:hypothetical protein